jgi:outer membrane immunogenic protein
MKCTLLAAATVLVAYGLGNASAADLGTRAAPVYKAPPPVAAPYSWTGFYVGANVGGGWSSGWSSTADPLPDATFMAINGLTFPSNNASGVIGGGQIGYNWQLNSNWLLGLETDFQGASLRGRQTITPLLRPNGAPLEPPFGPGSAFMNRELDWFGTVRARLGLTFDRWLVYGTGGFAYGEVKDTADINFNAAPVLAIFPASFPASISNTKTGWTAGAGVEYALPWNNWGNWTIRAEYLFVRLTGGETAVGSTPLIPPPTAWQYAWNRTDFHIARFGLNYRF